MHLTLSKKAAKNFDNRFCLLSHFSKEPVKITYVKLFIVYSQQTFENNYLLTFLGYKELLTDGPLKHLSHY